MLPSAAELRTGFGPPDEAESLVVIGSRDVTE